MGRRLTQRYWTDEEKKFLIKSYPDNKNKDIAECLNRNIKSIKMKAYGLNIKKTEAFTKRMKNECGKQITEMNKKRGNNSNGKYTGRKKAYKNKKEKCEICGYNKKEILELHHIVPNGDFCKINIKTLCPNCHKEVHRGLLRLK